MRVVYRDGVNPALLDLLIGLASFRLWRLLARDTILDAPRERFFARFPPDEKWVEYRAVRAAAKAKRRLTPAEVNAIVVKRPSYVGVLIDCGWCSGAWLSGLLVLAVTRYTSVRLPVLVWAAASTLVGLIAKMDG